jgi:endonuclease/exonuclease/phosphatase family metal-dependent hydrolase
MRIASWNLNNRVGRTPFRPDAAAAAVALDVDTIFFNEYFPQAHGPSFERELADAGLAHQIISTKTPARANRTFVASRVPVERDSIDLPTFDHQFPANVLAVRFPDSQLRVLALRIPAYKSSQNDLGLRSWAWLESAAATLIEHPAVIIGDLNVRAGSHRGRGAQQLQRIRKTGWTLASSDTEPSYFSSRGYAHTLDYLLHTAQVRVSCAPFVKAVNDYVLADGHAALSDHAAIVAVLHDQFRTVT